jgi:hypothetical protein
MTVISWLGCFKTIFKLTLKSRPIIADSSKGNILIIINLFNRTITVFFSMRERISSNMENIYKRYCKNEWYLFNPNLLPSRFLLFCKKFFLDFFG